jgi:hypothetical protein
MYRLDSRPSLPKNQWRYGKTIFAFPDQYVCGCNGRPIKASAARGRSAVVEIKYSAKPRGATLRPERVDRMDGWKQGWGQWTRRSTINNQGKYPQWSDSKRCKDKVRRGTTTEPTRSPRSDPMAGAGGRIRLVREMMWMLPGCFFLATQVVGMTSVLLRLQVRRHGCRLRSAIFLCSLVWDPGLFVFGPVSWTRHPHGGAGWFIRAMKCTVRCMLAHV